MNGTAPNQSRTSARDIKATLGGDAVEIDWPAFEGPYVIFVNTCGEHGADRPERLLSDTPSIAIPFNGNGIRLRVRSKLAEPGTWTIDVYVFQTRSGQAVVLSGEDLADRQLLAPTRIEASDNGNGTAKLEWTANDQEIVGAIYQISVWARTNATKDGFSFFKTHCTSHAIPIPDQGCRVRVAAFHPLDSRLRSAWAPPMTLAYVETQKNDRRLRVSEGFERPAQFHENARTIRERIEEKATVLDTFPLAMSVILEGRGCNLKCFYCSHIIPNASTTLHPDTTFTKGEMLDPVDPPVVRRVTGRTEGTPPAMINQVVEHLPYVATLMFGGSEPTLYPEFRQMLKELKNHPHVQCSVCTNGTLLHEKLANEILASNFPWIRVSIDGASDATFKKIRKGKFSKVINNLKAISEKRGEFGAPRMQFNFVVCRSNYHEIVDLVDLAHEVGVSVINYKMLISHAAYYEPFEREDPLWDKGLCVEIIDLMAEAKARASDKDVKLTNEAVTPAIFTEFPELRSPETRADVRRRHQAQIDERIRLRAENGDKPIKVELPTLAEYVERRREAGDLGAANKNEHARRRAALRASVENGAGQ